MRKCGSELFFTEILNMKRIITGILLFCLSTSCFGARPSGRVVGGTEAPEDKYPYQAYLEYEGDLLCGASIINERFLVTSGTCINGLKPTEIKIIVGTTNPKNGKGQTYSAQSTIIHPDYKMTGLFSQYPVNDVALIRLKKDIQFSEKVQPLKLPDQDFAIKNDSPLNFAGWGQLKYHGDYPESLQEIQLNVYRQSDCAQIWLSYKLVSIDQTMICTVANRGEGVCNGDSGSPLVSDGTLIGISSFGLPCAAGLPDVFTKVSFYVDWINENAN